LLKVRNKKFSLIMAIVFALTMVFPFAALASSTESLNQPVTDDDVITSLGTVFYQFTAGQIKADDTVSVRLPDGFHFVQQGSDNKDALQTGAESANNYWTKQTVGGSVYANIVGQVGTSANPGNYIEFPQFYGSNTNDNAFWNSADVTVKMLDDNELQLKVNGQPATGLNGYMYLHLGNVYVDSGFSGDIDLTMSAPSNSGFNNESIVVGRTSSSGSVDMEVTNVPTFSNSTSEDGSLKMRINEDIPDTIDDKSDSIKLKLPSGFAFDGTHPSSVNMIWGSFTANGITYNDTNKAAAEAFLQSKLNLDDDELTLDLNGTNFTSQKALNFEVTVDYSCDDETEAKLGDVVAKLTGSKSTINQNELTIGRYGQYDVSISAGDPTTIYAGAIDQIVGAVTIEESIKESLMPNRTITLKLPTGAKWAKIDSDSDNGVQLQFSSFPGTDGQTAKWQIGDKQSSDPATLSLDDLEVVTKPSFKGDLVVEVGGTAGLTGEFTLAKVVPPVTMATDGTTNNLVIGKSGQSIGDITITEAEAGLINDNADVLVDLPQGVRFDSYKVAVTSGDLKVYSLGVTTGSNSNTDDNTLIIPIDSTSSEASTITISDIKVTVDRTAPQGDVVAKVKGAALEKANDWNETQNYYDLDANKGKDSWVVATSDISSNPVNDFQLSGGLSFPEYATVTSVVAGTVGTPAPSESTLSTTVTLGDNGSYISDGRIMVQLRDAATALGVTNNNIFWDNATKTATFIKGDRVAQITVGDPQVKLNGVALPTDKGAELKDGHTYVSLSAAGVALGASASWDNTTKTATLSVK